MFESARPQPRPAHLSWSYRRIPPGGTLRGFVAGPLVGVHVHWSASSKPCRKKLTGGLLDCPFCSAELRARWLGYLPLFEHTGKRMVVTISETLGDRASALLFGTDVEFYRTNGARDPLRIRHPSDYSRSATPASLSKTGPQDIRRWLVHLWQDRDLAAFFAQQLELQGSQEHNAGSETHLPEPIPPPPSPPTLPFTGSLVDELNRREAADNATRAEAPTENGKPAKPSAKRRK